ncbi:c-type cytochrome [Myxococcus sp. RHSTA-1-4]|uniref:c-type cytochrome n=1 Tax=Myxococcus sp. RHSTA-1-4 TaxID=2874601 RepID=UPI001CBBE245|nr:c-type cytochrome [Myxococcus sp. RHSTA-1-4]MBZ4419096.1 c-type cytochrome [Myxococcus sp. RHSTA-1-4]
MSRLPGWLAVLACLTLVSGCDDDDDDETPDDGGAVSCPPGGTQLTEQNFGRAFLDSYCTRCHSSTRTGAARNGAPEGLNWDQIDVVRANADEMNEEAGANADGSVNSDMPPSDPRPTDDERRQLAEWLACGAP